MLKTEKKCIYPKKIAIFARPFFKTNKIQPMGANNSFLVFSGTKTRYLAEKICASLGCPLGNLVMTKFSDGEFAVSYEESIRGLFRRRTT